MEKEGSSVTITLSRRGIAETIVQIEELLFQLSKAERDKEILHAIVFLELGKINRKMFNLLFKQPGWRLDHESLIYAMDFSSINALTVQISRLRRDLKDTGFDVITNRSVGYQLIWKGEMET